MSAIIGGHNFFNDAGFATALGPLTASADADYASHTVVGKYKPGLLKAAGNIVRLTLHGHAAAGRSGTISNVYIGLASNAAGANAYDFDGGQVAVTFGGSNSVTLTSGVTQTSDQISLAIDGSKALLIAYNVAAASFISLRNGLGGNYSTYRKSGVAEAATASKGDTGYLATSGTSPLLFKLECAS